MRALWATTIGSIAAAVLGVAMPASPAQADWGDGYYHRWHPHEGWDRPDGPPALIATPRPNQAVPLAAYDALPDPSYAPHPVAATAPPAFGAPPAFDAPPAFGAPGDLLDFTVR